MAENGNPSAQFNLGVMYDNGQGAPQDSTEAARWFRLAAEQGYAAAQFNLGLLYLKGQGVPQDYLQAYMWFNIVAAQGDPEASKVRDLLAGVLAPLKAEDGSP